MRHGASLSQESRSQYVRLLAERDSQVADLKASLEVKTNLLDTSTSQIEELGEWLCDPHQQGYAMPRQ
jgi:hypothetical protein